MLSSLTNKKSALVCGLVLSMVAAAKATTSIEATYQLQALSSTDPNGVISNNNQTITLSQPGSTVTVGLYLVLHGADTNAGNDGGLNIVGSFTGPSSGLLGNFRGDTIGGASSPSTTNNVSGFTGPTSQSGFLINSNNTNPTTYNLGDDITLGTQPTMAKGTTPATGSNGYGFIGTATNSSSGYAGTTYGSTRDTNGNTDLLVGETTFTLLSSDATGFSTLNFIPTFATGIAGRNQVFVVDANEYLVNANGTGIEYINGTGSPQTISSSVLNEQGLLIDLVPEPTSLSILGLGSLALLRRRRSCIPRRSTVQA